MKNKIFHCVFVSTGKATNEQTGDGVGLAPLDGTKIYSDVSIHRLVIINHDDCDALYRCILVLSNVNQSMTCMYVDRLFLQFAKSSIRVLGTKCHVGARSETRMVLHASFKTYIFISVLCCKIHLPDHADTL